MASRISRLSAAARALWEDTEGVILPYVTIMLVVFIGTAVLALDGGRYMSLQTQLQKGADALAIAGAYELDRKPDSLTRATAAVNNLFSSTPHSTLFGTGGSVNVAISAIRFLHSLPGDATNPIPNSYVTAVPADARFIEVTVQPVSIPTILPAAFFGGATTVTAGAAAVAGNDEVACGITPVFICNPFEQPGDSYATATQRLITATSDTSFQRKLIRLANGGGGNATWGPGAFGYLYPEAGSLPNDGCFQGAAGDIGQAMAIGRPKSCYRKRGVDLRPGDPQEGKDGLNTRFGLYSQDFKCQASYVPDVNVRKGYKAGPSGNWCRATPDGSFTGTPPHTWPPGLEAKTVPLDDDMISNPAIMVGNGSWNCLNYWTSVYGTTPEAPAGCTATSTISRRSIYEYEIANPALLSRAPQTSKQTATAETGAPQCNAAAAQPGRREFAVAIVNCLSSPVPIQSNATNVPVAGFGKFFITHPTPGPGSDPYVEFMGMVEEGDGFNFDQVQLYR